MKHCCLKCYFLSSEMFSTKQSFPWIRIENASVVFVVLDFHSTVNRFLMAWVGSEKCNYVAITQYKELFSLKHNNIEKKVSKCSKGFKYSFFYF